VAGCKDFRHAGEIRYIQARPPNGKPRIVIDGHAFIYSDCETGRVATILCYPKKWSLKPDDLKLSNLLG
jgi:hypothetical protein